MKPSIVWLASYPKSGNTWVRLFIANYIMNSETPVPINQLPRFGSGDSVLHQYRAVGGAAVDLNDPRNSLRLRDRVLRGIVSNNADINLVKTHNKRTIANGVAVIPPQYTRSAIYVMRNPLDVVVSYARHYGMSLADTVTAICHKDNALAPDASSVASFLGSWSDHVASWTSKSSYPTLVLRYEDLLASPVDSFEKVVTHLNMTPDAQRLERAIQHSGFDELQRQEQAQGFVETSHKSKQFFVAGTKGQWRDQLSPELVKQVRQYNKKLMKQYGYWND